MNRKRILVSFMSLLLIASLLVSGCSKKDDSSDTSTKKAESTTEEKSKDSDAKEDETKEEKTALAPQKKPVRILNHIMGGKDPEENDLWAKEAKRLSGIDVEVVNVPGSEMETKITTAIAAGEDYDIMIMPGKNFLKLFPMGIFENITERINNSEVLGNPDIIDPTQWEAIKKDGALYGVLNKYEGGRLPLVRGDWMKNLNLEVPTTLDEYYELFRAFTFDDPDKNGEQDTIGLTMKQVYDIQPFMSSKGLVDGYAQNSEGKWVVPWATDDAAEVYDWLNKLYTDGLLDPNFATNGSSNCRELILNGKAGMFTYWDNWTGLFNDKLAAADPNTTAEIIGLPPALDSDGNGFITTPSKEQWVILSTSKNKDYAFKFLEFIHTNPGIQLCTLGIEGHDYTMENGKPVLTETGQQHGMDHGMVHAVSKQWVNPLGLPKNFKQSQDIVNKYGAMEIVRETSADAKDIVKKYAVQAIMGELTGTEAVAKMQADLKDKQLID